MKRIPEFVALVAILLGLTVANAFSQVVTSFKVTKNMNYVQVDGTTTPAESAANPPAAIFSAFVYGTGLPTAPGDSKLVTPGGTFPSPADLVGGSGTSMNLNTPGTYASVAAMNAAFGTGTYTFNVVGITPTGSVNLAANTFSIPQVSVAGASWSGNKLNLVQNQIYTFTFVSLAALSFQDTIDTITFNFDGTSQQTSQSGATASFSIDTTGMGIGDHHASLIFRNVTDTTTSNFGGAITGTASYQLGTEFIANVQAVPEPGTYAALFGVAALGFVAWRRRRQA
jgi:hypothetical protein